MFFFGFYRCKNRKVYLWDILILTVWFVKLTECPHHFSLSLSLSVRNGTSETNIFVCLILSEAIKFARLPDLSWGIFGLQVINLEASCFVEPCFSCTRYSVYSSSTPAFHLISVSIVFIWILLPLKQNWHNFTKLKSGLNSGKTSIFSLYYTKINFR